MSLVARVTRLADADPRLAWPLFTISEAARYLDMPASTLHHWAHPGRGRIPLITTSSREGARETVPFVGFAEAYVIRAATRAGVPRNRVRPGVEAVKERFASIEYALAHSCVYTDGAEILYREVRDAADADLTVATTNQTQFRKAVNSSLQLISYADDGFATRLRLPQFKAPVTVDPSVASGAPLVEHGGARVEDLIDRARAGDKPGAIARDFDVPVAEVREIVKAAA